MAIIDLHHVALPFPGTTEAFDEARSFYGGTLGLVEQSVPESLSSDVLWFAIGHQELHLFAEPTAAAWRESRRHAGLRVGNVAVVRARLAQAGVETFGGIPALPGRPRFFVRVPFGNVLEFMQLA